MVGSTTDTRLSLCNRSQWVINHTQSSARVYHHDMTFILPSWTARAARCLACHNMSVFAAERKTHDRVNELLHNDQSSEIKLNVTDALTFMTTPMIGRDKIFPGYGVGHRSMSLQANEPWIKIVNNHVVTDYMHNFYSKGKGKRKQSL